MYCHLESTCYRNERRNKTKCVPFVFFVFASPHFFRAAVSECELSVSGLPCGERNICVCVRLCHNLNTVRLYSLMFLCTILFGSVLQMNYILFFIILRNLVAPSTHVDFSLFNFSTRYAILTRLTAAGFRKDSHKNK